MKGRWLYLWTAGLILVLASALSAGELYQTVRFSPTDLVFSKAGGYDVVELNGCPASSDVGKPRLPRLVQALVMPAGAQVRSVEVVFIEEGSLEGTYDIIPAQPDVPLPMPGRKFTTSEPSPDLGVYSVNEAYPSKVVRTLGTGTLCGYSIGHVEINPVRYNPVSKQLTVASRITYRVVYDESATEGTVPTAYQKEVFGQEVRNLVANPQAVDLYAPRISAGTGVTSLPPGTFKYVIISTPPVDTVFQRLATWKTAKGVPDTVVRMSYIVANYTGYDTIEKVRKFIKDAKNTWGTVYVLLGGQGDERNSGQNLVPARKAYYIQSGVGGYTDEDTIPCDLYYSDLDSTWDANNNHVWGQRADAVNMYADIYVGRAPVRTVAQAQNFVAKVLKYEQSPPTGYVAKMLLPTGILWSSYEERPTQRAIARMTPTGWLDDSLFERNGTLSRAAMVSSMNNGRGMGHWVGHGDENGIYYNGGSSVYYSSSDADAASNGDKEGIAIAIACFNGAWDEVSGGDCLAEHIVNRVGGGCVGVMMNSRYGWGAYVSGYVMGPSERIDTTFYSKIFARNTYHLGPALAAAKDAWVPYADSARQYDMTRWCLYELNLLGDPELPLWTAEPTAMTVSHPTSITTGSQSFTVTVSAFLDAVDSASVCLWKGSEVYATGLTNSSGQFTTTINPTTVGTMSVTVTKQNRLPYQGTCGVASGVDAEPTPGLLPLRFELGVPKPNPAKGIGTVQYALPKESQVSLKVYDASGRCVKTLASGCEAAGWKRISWDSKDLAAGVYFYRFEACGFTTTRKLVVVR